MHRFGQIATVLTLCSGAFLAPGGSGGGRAPARGAGKPFVSGEILVRFRPAAPARERANARAGLDARRLHRFRSGAEFWRLGPGRNVAQALDRLARNPHVEYAEPNYLITADVVPDDPDLGLQYGLINDGQTGGTPDADIDAELAWGLTTGNGNVVVAVLDSGIDLDHPDLAASLWIHPGETAGNGVDDDGNGYVDDLHGWDFVGHDNDPDDDSGHGTHVAGIIGAVGNNGTGVTGVAWQVRILPLRILGPTGSGTVADAARALDYATDLGVDLTNNSWGLDAFSLTLRDAVAAADDAGILLIAAAGNSGRDTDVEPYYPAGFDLGNVISVAATNHYDGRYLQSNYGAVSVDLAAPGVSIHSTLPGGQYGSRTGTSMAAPHVAGAAALIRALAPGVSAAQLKSRILEFVDPIGSMAGLCVSGGRLNAFAALQFDGCVDDPDCDDGIFCNGTETCDGGLCLWGTPPCDDFDPCTVNVCDEPAEACSFPPVPDGETAAGPDGLCETADDNLELFGADGICGTAADLAGDGVCNVIDTCPDTFDPGQRDTDDDGLGDACDPEPCRREIVMSSSQEFFDSGALTYHNFVLPARPAAGGLVEATVEGDFNDPLETAIVFAEGLSLGHVGDSAGPEICTADADDFVIYETEMPYLAADGVVSVGVSNSQEVGPFCVANRHSVTFRYTGELRLSLPGAALGGVGGTAVVPVNLNDVTGLGIDSATVTVRFNPAVLLPAAVTTGTLTAGFTLTSDLTVFGEVSLQVSGPAPVSGAGSIAEITFDVVGFDGEATPLRVAAATLNGGEFDPCFRDGRLLVVRCVDADGDGFGSPGDPSCPAGAATDCDDGNGAIHPGGSEICDGLDNDCDGGVDNPPSPGGIADLTVEDSMLSWDALGETTGYDVVRGNLALLRSSSGDFTAATAACLADDHPSTSLAEADPPVPGEGFWFLLRPVNCGGSGTYDCGAPSQSGFRDAEVDTSPDSCN